MAKFTGYYTRWDKCPECGLRLKRVGDSLRHRPGWKVTHHAVIALKRDIRDSAALKLLAARR